MSRFDSCLIFNFCLSCFDILVKCYIKHTLKDSFESSVLYGSIIHNQLQYLLTKNSGKEQCSSTQLITLFSYIKSFMSEPQNVFYLFSQNDFIFHQVPLLEKTLNLLLEYSKLAVTPEQAEQYWVSQ